MKLSRKARKRLWITVAVIFSPVIILGLLYLSYLEEPAEYARLKRSLKVDIPQVKSTTPQGALLEENDGSTTKSVTFSIKRHLYELNYGLQKCLDNVGPLIGAGYATQANFPVHQEGDVTQWLMELYPKRAQFWDHYTEKYPLDTELLHRVLDQFVEWELSYEELEPFTASDISLIKGNAIGDLYLLAVYRAYLNGDKVLCRRLFHRYTQIALEYSYTNSFYRMYHYSGFICACYEFGLLSDEDLSELKTQFIQLHQQISLNRQEYILLAKRNALLVDYTEKSCEHLMNSELGSNTDTFDLMLKDALGGVPKVAWDGVMAPVYCYYLREYAAVICANDLHQIRKMREENETWLCSNDLYHHVRDLERTAFNNTTGLCPDQIYDDFPWLRESHWYQNRVLALIALVEMLEDHSREGVYPVGQYTEKLPVEYTSEYHQFYLIKTDVMNVPVIVWEDEETTKTMERQLPERYHFFDVQYTDNIPDSDVDYWRNLDDLVMKPDLHQAYQERVENLKYLHWSLFYWREAEPILREILVDQRPGETGELD